MGTTQNLHGTDAVKKLKELAEGVDICMFCTNVDKMPFNARPMSTQEVDEEGNIWFFSSRNSDKNAETKTDNRVQLLYAKISDSHYLSVYGHAEEVYDKARIDRYWNNFIKAWFPGGKDDPNLSLLKVKPEEAHYWDTKDGKLISVLKIGVAAVTGKTMDGGVEGDLKVPGTGR